MKYTLEYGIETKKCLSSIFKSNNAKDIRARIDALPTDIWYSVYYSNTHQDIVNKHTGQVVTYNSGMIVPKVLECLK